MSITVCVVDEEDQPDPSERTWVDLTPVVESVSKRVYWQYRQFVELEDVSQECWYAYFSNASAWEQLLTTVAGLTYVRRRMQSAATTYCIKEMCHRTGVQWEDQYRYTNGEVRNLVVLILSGGPEGTESQNLLTGYVDVKRAISALGSVDAEILWRAYGPDPRDEPMTATDRGKASRAVRRIQRQLNGEGDSSDQQQPPESHADA